AARTWRRGDPGRQRQRGAGRSSNGGRRPKILEGAPACSRRADLGGATGGLGGCWQDKRGTARKSLRLPCKCPFGGEPAMIGVDQIHECGSCRTLVPLLCHDRSSRRAQLVRNAT